MINKLTYFDKYIENSSELDKYIVSNNKNRVVVYKENIEDEIFYIKKYIPYGKRKIRTAFGIFDDRVIHYEKVSKKLKKIDIPFVKLEYKKIIKKSFFERVSILVTRDAGKTLEECLINFNENKKLLTMYYNFFIKLVENNIYPIDYNTGGFLIDKYGEIKLSDFDDYRINCLLTKKLKKRLIKNLRRIYQEIPRSIEEKKFLEIQIDRVIKRLGWTINE